MSSATGISGRRRRSVTPARRCAYRVIRRVFEQGAFADRALRGEAQGLDARERAFATALAYGVVQRRRTLDHVLAPLCSRGLERVEAPVLAALRLGAHQLLLMGGVSEYAAVNESVELVNQERPRAGAFVNAVLRRVAREGRAALAALDDATPARAAVLHSVPDWLAGLWWQELGADDARALLARVNEPPESSLRVNTLREPDPGAVRARLAQAGVSVRPAAPWAAQPDLPELPEAVIVEGAYDVFASELWRDGVVMPQSRGSMVVARVLAPEPGQRVLDLCAAPGGKTTQLAALIGDRGELVAVELHPGRARALARTCERMAAGCVRVLNADGRELDAAAVEPGFDRVLVDPPCSGLGTLQIRPDLRWRARRASVEVLAQGQLELLDVAAAQLRPGGTLVYSVCTLTRAESGGVVEAFLTRHSEFTLERSWRLLPHREQTDGFFLARLTRAG